MPLPSSGDGSLDKVNFVIDSWSTGCDAPWYIYIETMRPAALEALIVLLSFGWADVVRGALRPKGLGRRSSKRKGKWSRRIPAFPELGNTIGKNLPFAEQIEDFTHYRAGTRHLWRIDTGMQALLFWWLVVDVAEDFAFNWTSLLYESYWCQPDPPGRFSYRNTPTPGKSGGVWWTEGYGTRDYQYAPPSWGFLTGRTGPKGATITAAVTFIAQNPLDPVTECGVRIINRSTGEVLSETTSTEPDDDGINRVPVIHRENNDILFRVQARHNSAWAWVGNGFVAATANEAP